MKRIVILSNLDEQCGNAIDARNIAQAISPWFDVQVMNSHLYPIHAKNPDVVMIAWHPARVGVDAPLVHQLQSQGSKVVLILQNSFDWEHHVAKSDLLAQCNAVVAHEEMTVTYDGEPAKNVFCIPVGMLELEGLHEWDGSILPMIGTAGFQFPWKRTDIVVKAAKHCNIEARIICPPYPGFDRNRAIDSWQQLYNRVHVERNWLPEEQVIRMMAEHVLNIFWFQSQDIHDKLGQSGSVRLGLAARRPTIISDHRKFRTLLPYADELYIAATENDVYNMTSEILANPSAAKRPNRVVKDMGWSAIGAKYRDVIESL